MTTLFRYFIFIVLGMLLIVSFIGFWMVYRGDRRPSLLQLPPGPYAVWNMDFDVGDNIADSTGRYDAKSFNTKVIEGYLGKGRYFNGEDSYIETPISFQGWKAVTISCWVKPEGISGEGISVILDNGHTAETDFIIQSADSSGEKWIWHCNGVDILLPLSHKQWGHIVISADAENGMILVYVNGIEVGVMLIKPFEFGPTKLTIGRLAKLGGRYFKGSIDEVQIWNRAIY